jgi:hypothetical protein
MCLINPRAAKTHRALICEIDTEKTRLYERSAAKLEKKPRGRRRFEATDCCC